MGRVGFLVAVALLFSGCTQSFDFLGLQFEEQGPGDYKLNVLLLPYKEDTAAGRDKWSTAEEGSYSMTIDGGTGTLWWGVYRAGAANPLREQKLDFVLNAHGAGATWKIDGDERVVLSVSGMTYTDRAV